MLTLALAAAAVGASPYCPSPTDGIAAAELFLVTPGPRVPFHRTADCAGAGCGEGAYVVPGDRVVVYRRQGRRVCALFDRTRETTGWIDADRLAPDPAAARPPLPAWAGDWYDGDDHIRLAPAAAAGRLRVTGDAYWPAAHPADRPYGPNIGQLDGTARPAGDRLDYSDGAGEFDCRATLRLLGPYLLVEDNGSCGGMNVRFTGTYRRRDAHRPATRS